MARGTQDRKRHINHAYSSIPRDTCSLTRYFRNQHCPGLLSCGSALSFDESDTNSFHLVNVSTACYIRLIFYLAWKVEIRKHCKFY